MDPDLTPNALTVLERRYLARNDEGRVVETPAAMFQRVARAVAEAERAFGGDPAAWAERFFRRMARLEFLPNSPTLMNAGRDLGQLAACFVVPVGDSMPEIFDAVKWAAEIQMTGGGTGFAFSRLRPAGDRVSTTKGVASGPMAFMDVFNAATDAVRQGGTRRGANMGVLRVDHPDILEFIAAKLEGTRLANFNVSVAITDDFMAAAAGGRDYALVNPRTGKTVRRLDAARVLRLMANAAWRTGDPGVIFIDRINAANPTPQIGAIEATNPCVTGDTRVLVEDVGWVPIAELVGRTPRIATWRDGRLEFHTATQVIATGIKRILRLRTLEGPELRLTADHLVTTDVGDVSAETLQRGDRLRFSLAVSAPIDRNSRESRLGEVVGWLTGDGHFTTHSHGKPTVVLSFYGDDKIVAGARLRDAVCELIDDEDLRLNPVSSRDMQYLRSARLRRCLAERGVDERCKAQVPELVWRGSTSLVAGYLRALFSADGSVQGTIEGGASVRLAANELPLLRDVQLLLCRLGVRSVIYANRRTEHRKRMPDGHGALREYVCAAQHELSVARASLRAFAELVGFIIPAKGDRLGAILDQYARGAYRDAEYVTIDEVVVEGDEEVFDLSEPVTRHFFANGILVHNCGEQPLLPFESCVLGSINLDRFARGGGVDWERLRGAVHEGVRFLDDVIEVNRYPLPQIERVTRANRKIGLGVMGLADLLIRVGVPYDSTRALEIGEEIAAFVEKESLEASVALARERGAFASFAMSRWAEKGQAPLRNATTTTVAPTGTISIIAGCSSGIEPLFAVSYTRHVLDGERLVEVHPGFLAAARERGIWTPELAEALVVRGRVRGLDGVPGDLQALYPTAHDLSPETHVRMQAVFQKHAHAAVSKTVNFPEDASPEDVLRVYRLAYDLGCKGVTVYRDRSKSEQVLSFGDTGSVATREITLPPPTTLCPECGSLVVGDRGCTACRECGWSICG